jgi:hypothetical protein
MWYGHIIEYYSAIKKIKFFHLPAWMNLETLCYVKQVSQTEQQTLHYLNYICNFKKVGFIEVVNKSSGYQRLRKGRRRD